MFKLSEFTKENYSPKEVSSYLGVTVRTLQVWDTQGKIPFHRSETNRRYLDKNSLINILKERNMIFDDSDLHKRDVLYARVSSHEQKNSGDLDRQVSYLVSNVSDLQNPLVLSEVGSGLNDNRVKIQKLIEMVMNDEVHRIFVTYKDRLTRFGFHYLETICKHHNVSIHILKEYSNDSKEKTIHDELVEDMISLVSSFSGRIYGLRSQKAKKIEKDIKEMVTK